MSRQRFQTPDTMTPATICRRLVIPDDPIVIAAVNGALNALSDPANWELYGSIQPEDIAYKMLLMVEEFFVSDCMLGTITAHHFQTLPDNLISCDGGLYLRADYPALYSRLSSNAPALVIDPDHFQTPDLRSRFVYGGGDPMDYSGVGGVSDHSLTVDEMPAHNHTTQPHSHSTIPHTHTNIPHVHGYVMPVPIAITAGEIPWGTVAAAPSITEPSGVIIDPAGVTIDAATVLTDNAGAGLAHTNMPPYIVLGYAMVAR